MKSVLIALCVAGSLGFAMIVAVAQERAATNDPRVGLKAGFYDAGEAARNMERVAGMPKAKGFFDPKTPAGEPTPPEREQNERAANNPGTTAGGGTTAATGEAAAGAAAAAGEGAEPRDPNAPPPFDPRLANRLGFANSDLAFSRNHVFEGNFHGFNTYDVDSARKPRLLASVVCPGGQGDLSVYGNLLFMSVEQTRGRIDCGTQGNEQPVSSERFRGAQLRRHCECPHFESRRLLVGLGDILEFRSPRRFRDDSGWPDRRHRLGVYRRCQRFPDPVQH